MPLSVPARKLVCRCGKQSDARVFFLDISLQTAHNNVRKCEEIFYEYY